VHTASSQQLGRFIPRSDQHCATGCTGTRPTPTTSLFVEHFADQAADDAHTGSPAYRELIAGQLADLIVEFVEIDHELLVGL
jgi:quinol monooxygenase YgiN